MDQTPEAAPQADTSRAGTPQSRGVAREERPEEAEAHEQDHSLAGSGVRQATPGSAAHEAPTEAGDGTGTPENGARTATPESPRRGAKHLHHPAAPATEEIRRRLRSVEGHVRGVNRMVEEGAYCIDVVNQILAVERALKKVSGLVLDRHLHTCATTALRSESLEERERVIGEILDVFEAAGKA